MRFAGQVLEIGLVDNDQGLGHQIKLTPRARSCKAAAIVAPFEEIA
jgi:hypothetical protein